MLTLDVAVKSPWHVFGKGAEDGQPVRVEFLEGSSFGAASELQLPPGRKGVLEGSFRITLPLKRTGKGDKILAELVYQACNEEICMPPKRLKIEESVTAAKRKPLSPSTRSDVKRRDRFIDGMEVHLEKGSTVKAEKLAGQLDPAGCASR